MFQHLFILSFITLCTSCIIELEEKNSIIIKGPIYKETSNKFFNDLKGFQGSELNIFISSPGGSVMEGMKMIDHITTLQDQNIKINCIADFAASMAFRILYELPLPLIATSKSPSSIIALTCPAKTSV